MEFQNLLYQLIHQGCLEIHIIALFQIEMFIDVTILVHCYCVAIVTLSTLLT